MQDDRFEGILDKQLQRIRDVLVVKAAEYATEDCLANFKKAAHLRGVTLTQAVSGMMVKHTVSIFDMVESGDWFTPDQWDEKITDHLNYLILLRAAVIESGEHPALDNFGNSTLAELGCSKRT